MAAANRLVNTDKRIRCSDTNCRTIKCALRDLGPMTRREIAEATGLENGEVSARVKEMLDRFELTAKGYKPSPITGLAVGVVRVAK